MGLKPVNDIIKHILQRLLWLLENRLGDWEKKRKTTQEAIAVGFVGGDGDLDYGGETEVVRSAKFCILKGE